jgi:hypothetical protein
MLSQGSQLNNTQGNVILTFNADSTILIKCLALSLELNTTVGILHIFINKTKLCMFIEFTTFLRLLGSATVSVQ